MNNKIKQLRKGILELAIFGALAQGPHYGYSLIRHLAKGRGIDLTEGTIYPILNRLLREGLISSEWRESHQGPPRKYYALTPEGEKAHQILEKEFTRLQALVVQASQPAEDSGEEMRPNQIDIKSETHHDK